MNERNPIENDQHENPYKKVFDDANRAIRKHGDLEFLDNLPADLDQKLPGIPFPYGSSTARPYNSNVK